MLGHFKLFYKLFSIGRFYFLRPTPFLSSITNHILNIMFKGPEPKINNRKKRIRNSSSSTFSAPFSNGSHMTIFDLVYVDLPSAQERPLYSVARTKPDRSVSLGRPYNIRRVIIYPRRDPAVLNVKIASPFPRCLYTPGISKPQSRTAHAPS